MRKGTTDCTHRIVNVMAAPSVMESPARNVIICPPDIGSEGVNVGGLEESYPKSVVRSRMLLILSPPIVCG